MLTLRLSAFLFFFIASLCSPASASELTLRFRSGHSIFDIKPKYYRNDIFILLHDNKTEELISVDSLVSIQHEKGRPTVPGIIFGFVGGAIVGGAIERSKNGHGSVGVVSGTALIGGLIGGIVGGVIGSIIGGSDEILDLSNADIDFKIETLKKFSQ